ncbi:MAG: type II toxin-antitoxin system mRNA interferase toxin, RelE/StbE family [Deltaproteobacteria bacterium HGW-Deltaproteobacteria-23]|nr:MAG: type II toxin-antitoxin system mRNA interferase toxin, RelE/StbE family [Deltaproteobacteria bacterium HGW-Deltaproteobacteria-23]
MRVKWLRLAIADLDELEAWIVRDNPTAAAAMLLKIARTVSLLAAHPGIGRAGRIPGTKELVIPDAPYIVPYRVKGNVVEVLRVYHTSRQWPERR